MDLQFLKRNKDDDLSDILALLKAHDLALDPDISLIISAHTPDGAVVGCGGIAGDVVKALAIVPEFRGETVALPLMTEIVATAWELGEKDLFLYTKPDNEEMFSHCGFMTLARVPGTAVLMENNKQRLVTFCDALKKERREGSNIAGLVMRCDPFTYGHRFLAETAAAENDWVHLFLMQEDASLLPFKERLSMVLEGTADIPNLTVHPGSVYIISRAAFPGSYLHDPATLERAYTGIDVQIFRKYIAPALGITSRYVGTEPFSAITSLYTTDMDFWLKTECLAAPALKFHQLPLLEQKGIPISTSRVRGLWREQGLDALQPLVPASTLEHLKNLEPPTE